MSQIQSFTFSESGVEAIRNHKYGQDWPVVYLIENGRDMYVGESVSGYRRSKEHLKVEIRKKLKKIHIIADDEFNMSAAKDAESSLIEYLIADGLFTLQNSNAGLQNHSFYDREKYQGKFDVLWTKLQEMKLAKNDLLQIRNSEIFKYSPYKTLTDDQYLVATQILSSLLDDPVTSHVVHGGPGTGKSIVATYLIKQLVENGVTNVALVIAMTPLRNTLKKVFRGIPGLKSSMVIGPAEAAIGNYDVLVVDETHRLRQRKNIPNYGTFDKINRSLGLPVTADELDWVVRGGKKLVLFYDAKQTVRPSDIDPNRIESLGSKSYALKTQMRVKGGEKYLAFIDNALENGNAPTPAFTNYDLKLFEDIDEMVNAIKSKNAEIGLCRLVAGYAWEWVSRKNKTQPDIVIGDTKLFWNTQLKDWVNSKNAVNEVGCIHTTQGYDLNYAGVIIGPEVSYNKENDKITVNKNYYFDTNGHRGVTDPEELKRYIINIYKTLMTRGISGTYLYVVDDGLRNYIKDQIDGQANQHDQKVFSSEAKFVESPYQEAMTTLPLYDSVGCGELMYADPVAHETHEVPSSLIQPGAKYFVLRAQGDSMNLLGINDGDLILCQKNYQAPSGSAAIVLIGEEATLKEIQYERDGLLLKPKSTNPEHRPYKLDQYDEFKVLGVFVRKL